MARRLLNRDLQSTTFEMMSSSKSVGPTQVPAVLHSNALLTSCLPRGTFFLLPTAILLGLVSVSFAAQEQPTHRGLVVDPDGEVVEGAELFTTTYDGEFSKQLATTDADGRFLVSVEDPGLKMMYLLARKEGAGLAMSAASNFELRKSTEDSPLGLQLTAPGNLSGQLVDEDGNALEGIRVVPVTLYDYRDRGLSRLESAEELAKGYSAVVQAGGWQVSGPVLLSLASATTDASGRFQLKGFGAGRVVRILVIGPTVKAEVIHVRTDDGDTVYTPFNSSNPKAEKIPIYARDFQHSLSPGTSITGHVRTETGAPAVDAMVKPRRFYSANFLGASDRLLAVKTDAEGAYRLDGLPLGRVRLNVVPPKGTPYLAAERTPVMKAGESRVNVDFNLTRGIRITGQATDANTGEAVPGRLRYFAFKDNPSLKSLKGIGLTADVVAAQTSDDGKYSLIALPGRGILAFNTTTKLGDNYQRAQGADQITRARIDVGNGSLIDVRPHAIIPFNFHLIKEIDLPSEKDEHVVDLELTGARRIIGIQFVNAGGGALGRVYYSNSSPDGGPFKIAERDPFGRISGVVRFFDEEKGRLVQARTSDYSMSGWAYVEAADQEVALAMFPAAKIQGQLVDAKGQPVAGAILKTQFNQDTSKVIGELPANPKTSGYVYWTDEQGRFEFVGLPADLPLSVTVSTRKGRSSMLRGMLFSELTLETSQSLDLGKIRMDKLKPLPKPARAN